MVSVMVLNRMPMRARQKTNFRIHEYVCNL